MEKELEEITWNNGGFFWNSKFKKVNPNPIGDPTQIRGITNEQRLKNLKELVNKKYKNFDINAYSSGVVSIDGMYSTVIQFYKI